MILLITLAWASLCSFVLADHTWNFAYLATLAVEELDPIVSPNRQSSHMHRIIGGSAFSAAYDPDRQLTSSCSSVGFQDDKSNYWMPQLYWIDHKNNSYVPMPMTPSFYYVMNQNSPSDPVHPFPKGLRMLAGNPDNKDLTAAGAWSKYVCQTGIGQSFGSTDGSFNFNDPCVNGVRAVVFFPSCWDGVNLYKADHSHVVYPGGGNGPSKGQCPMSNPFKIPAITLEFTYRSRDIAPGVNVAGNLAWANGDTTGGGIHADFTEGWEQDVLAAAMNSTDCGAGSGQTMSAQDCYLLAKSLDMNKAWGCTPDAGVLREPFGNDDLVPIPRLPGCNPLWASGSKPSCSPAPASLDVARFENTDGPYIAAQPLNRSSLPVGPGYQFVQCITDQSVTGSTMIFKDSAMTQDICFASCYRANMPYAVLGSSTWCYCGESIGNPRIAPGVCTDPCPGNATQTCGNQSKYRFSLFYAPPGTPPPVSAASVAKAAQGDGASYMGCVQGKPFSTSTFSFQSSYLTVSGCNVACAQRNASWAATADGNWCICGTDLPSQSWISDGMCMTSCSGNSSTTCGGANNSQLYNVSSTFDSKQLSTGNHAAGWQGCFSQSGTSLNMAGPSLMLSTMTQSLCVSNCAEVGYSLAALRSGNLCQCGDSYSGTTALPAAQCNAPCAGNATETCGSSITNRNWDIYRTDGWPSVEQYGVNKLGQTGYKGCYSGSASSPVLGDYTFSDSRMSIEMCRSGCLHFGYQFSAVFKSTICQCGSVLKASQIFSSTNCGRACPGDSGEFCGGDYAASVYMSTATANSTAPGASGNNSTTAGGASNSSAASTALYRGCYSNSPQGLTGYKISLDDIATVTQCRTTCKELGYSLGGLTQGAVCLCGNDWQGGQALPPSQCTMPCRGNSSEICGDSNAASLWSTLGAPPVPTQPAGWIGCYQYALQGPSYTTSGMSSAVCRASCASQGYSLAATQFGNGCICGNSIGGSQVPQLSCNTPCSGAAKENCGGNWIQSVYNSTTASNGTDTAADQLANAACYSDYSSLNSYYYSSDYMSLSVCAAQCLARNYRYAGVRAGNTCLCGNQKPFKVQPSSSCGQVCSANSTQSCGSSGAANVVDATAVGAPSSGFLMAANATGFAGCFKDGKVRMMASQLYVSNTLTKAQCLSDCAGLGYTLAGIENGKECWCTDSLNVASNGYQVATGNCNTPCAGRDDTATCGGSGLLSTYQISTANADLSALPQPGAGRCYGTGQITSQGYYAFGGAPTTQDTCRQTCFLKQYTVAATLNGKQCYCANSTALVGDRVANSLCNTGCAGNSSQTCGGSGSVRVFDTTAVSLPRYSHAEGYVACMYAWDTNAMPGWFGGISPMTPANCRSTCATKGFDFAGLLGNNKCLCSASVANSYVVPESQCSLACRDDSTDQCGGNYAISVYRARLANIPSPAVNNASTSLSSSAGPSPSASNTRLSSSSSFAVVSDASMSGHSQTPTSSNATVALVSSRLSNAASPVSTTSSGIASVASGQSSAASRPLLMSSASGTGSQSSAMSGSFVSSTSASMLPSSIASSLGPPSLSISLTPSSAGLQQLVATNGTMSMAASSGTRSMSTQDTLITSISSVSGVPSEVANPPVPTTVTVTITANSTQGSNGLTKTVTNTVTATMSVASASASDLGCYDGRNSSQSFSLGSMRCDSLTPPMCQTWCSSQGWRYSGISSGNLCGCASDLSSLQSVAQAQCSTSCVGNAGLKCGGSTGIFSVMSSF